jgi:hypothetical protein
MGSEKRLHTRTRCFKYCILMDHDGDTCEGLLGNMSESGAMLMISGDNHVHVGDVCDLMFSDVSTKFPIKRTVKIVRFNSGNIGVSFFT